MELSGLNDPELVPQALAATLNIPEGPLQPLIDALCRTLQSSEALLILDNCAHLVEACALLAGRIARACPRIRILATSQVPLRTSGEALLPLGPLSVPGPEERDSRRIRSSESARLFAGRARGVQPDFELSDDVVLSVAEICRRLNGIPLDLELASARLRGMALSDIANGLDERFQLLTSGDRTAPARQRTLRAMMEWSTAQLDAAQLCVLRRLSVFSSGWTRDAAAIVCSDVALTPAQSLQAMDALVERSLVVLDDWRDRPRYRLLETVRAYGLEHLRAADEDQTVRLRHQDWYLTMMEHAEDEILEDELDWLHRMDQEVENVRAALDLCLIEPATAERAAYASYAFWQYTDSLAASQKWFDGLPLSWPSCQRASIPLAGTCARRCSVTVSGRKADLTRRYRDLRPCCASRMRLTIRGRSSGLVLFTSSGCCSRGIRKGSPWRGMR